MANGDKNKSSATTPLLSMTDSRDEDEAPNRQQTNVILEMWDLLKLAIPIFVGFVAFSAMKTTDSALIGHAGSKYLDASAYSDLWTQSTGVFVYARVLGIFAGQAVGAGNPKLAGAWAQVSLVVSVGMAVIVAVAWSLTGPVLKAFKVSHEFVWPAFYYALILLTCMPARILNTTINQYFQAQRIMSPAVTSALLAVALNLVFGLVFVLGIPFDPNPKSGEKGFGFWACPIVTAAMEYVQLVFVFVVYVYWKQLHAPAWPGFSWSHITKDRVWTYLKMYVPAALAIGSDFWRVAAIGMVAARLGSDQLGVFNASYRILWICLTLIGSVAGAVGIKLGIAFGRGCVGDAKFTTGVGLSLAFGILIILGFVVYSIPRQLGKMFTSDPVLLDMFYEARVPLALVMVVMNFSVALERIPTMMGKTRDVMVMGLIGSWVGQVPGVILFTKYWRDDLVGLFSGMAAGYALLVVLYGWLIYNADWEQAAKDAAERSEKETADGATTVKEAAAGADDDVEAAGGGGGRKKKGGAADEDEDEDEDDGEGVDNRRLIPQRSSGIISDSTASGDV